MENKICQKEKVLFYQLGHLALTKDEQMFGVNNYFLNMLIGFLSGVESGAGQSP